MPSKDSETCKKCEHYDNCQSKQMVECAYMTPKQPLQTEMIAEHDYREVKIAPNTKITIDLEDIKRQLSNRLSCVKSLKRCEQNEK